MNWHIQCIPQRSFNQLLTWGTPVPRSPQFVTLFCTSPASSSLYSWSKPLETHPATRNILFSHLGTLRSPSSVSAQGAAGTKHQSTPHGKIISVSLQWELFNKHTTHGSFELCWTDAYQEMLLSFWDTSLRSEDTKASVSSVCSVLPWTQTWAESELLRAQVLQQTFTAAIQQAQCSFRAQCKPTPLRQPLTASGDASPTREETSPLHEKGNPGTGLFLPHWHCISPFCSERATEFNHTATTSTAKKFNKTGLISENVLKYIYLYINLTHCISLHKWWSFLKLYLGNVHF